MEGLEVNGDYRTLQEEKVFCLELTAAQFRLIDSENLPSRVELGQNKRMTIIRMHYGQCIC
jgi:hypothetical protein